MFSGVAVLSNPVVGAKPGYLIFEAQIWVDHSEETPSGLLGTLSFYNKDDLTFENAPTFFSINSTFALYERNLLTGKLSSNSGYHFTGDIEEVHSRLIPFLDWLEG